MIIIYGTSKAHAIKTQSVSGSTCPHCNENTSFFLSTFLRYAHVYFIPLFSMGKYSVVVCEHCGAELKNRQRSHNMQLEISNMKAATRIPFYHFAGISLILFLLAGLFISGTFSHSNTVYTAYPVNIPNTSTTANTSTPTANYLAYPRTGDVYEYKTESGYSLFKLGTVGYDSLEVYFNQYESDRISGLYQIDKPDKYEAHTYQMAYSDMLDLYEAGKILDVKRP